jgi:hypothetical protein
MVVAVVVVGWLQAAGALLVRGLQVLVGCR